ncbi:hypothetical protein [Vibrio metschnikovii]|uniref:Uncharacterized protein n=2 Tax=Unclassified Bacteria TaxID=49928 RepID=A0AAU6TI16_UNCXX|nr:hypothetical protein [Vibrio metschnikovii]EKO3666874.1 hypothetical protein [Vibrio metschnikovii]EKO3704621.1 hypothetical protein [Vibrio metschnikovii]EKO3874273.1 hypothetical protein [Vibrio metschnikovii]EKO3884297.1 hypothetical protein [Vibrio metschnikovii]
MDVVKGIIDKELYSHIKTDKEFCYLLWLMLSERNYLDIHHCKYSYYNFDYTVKYSLYNYIHSNLHEETYKIPPPPRTHHERVDDIICFLFGVEKIEIMKSLLDSRVNLHFEPNAFFKFLRLQKAKYNSKQRFNWLSHRNEKLCLWTYNYLCKSGVIDKSFFYNNEDLILHCKVGFFLWGELDEVKSERYRRLILARDERNYRERKSKKTNRERTKRTSKKYAKKDVYENILLMLNKGADIDVIYDAVSDIRSRLVKFDGDLK